MDGEDMVRERNTESGSREESQRSHWVLGLALLGVVLAVVIGAIFLDRELRPRVGIEPAPTPASAAQAPGSPLATATTPAATTAVASSTIATAHDPTPAPSPTGLSVATSTLEREIEDAYLHYWDVLAQAYVNLDTSRLATAMSGAELTRQEGQIQALEAEGKAAKLDVEHRIVLVQVSPEHAIIYDEYTNRSVYLDAATKRELPTHDPPSMEKITFEMKRLEGNWKVIDGTRHD